MNVRDTIELIKSIGGMACVLAPLLYTDYHNPVNTVSAQKMSVFQWELYYRCWYLHAKT